MGRPRSFASGPTRADFASRGFRWEEEDNDVERVLRYLVSAWDEIQPGIRDTPVFLLGSMSPDMDMVLSAFINVASELSEHTVFVLDDCHRVESRAVYQALSFLIDHAPPTLHFALAGRRVPPLPLARHRARGELLELGIEDLRFRKEETREFLIHRSTGGLSDEAIALVQAQLEGWIAGLQLVCHAVLHRPEAVGLLSITGKHRFIADYLNEEVLVNLDGATRGPFLLQTSIFDRLNGDLCDATTGRNDDGGASTVRGDAGTGTGSFSPRSMTPRDWLRYHPALCRCVCVCVYARGAAAAAGTGDCRTPIAGPPDGS